MPRIAVLTSGGDAAGMNAAIRAVTRCALAQGWEVLGVHRGYAGLMEGSFQPLGARTVGGIIQQGGTVLGSARAPAFQTEGGRQRAFQLLRERAVDGLVVIGGGGSLAGAAALSDLGFPTVGIASTIDNDVLGSDITIGADTAVNVAIEAIDRLKVTAASHRRAFLVEVMGRDCGYLALMAGLAGGAEAIVIPEIATSPEEVARRLSAAYARGKAHAITVVSEGARCGAADLIAYFEEHQATIGFELRATILGHVQRGGTPTAYDRWLGSRLGAGAIAALARGESGVLLGLVRGRVVATPFAEMAGRQKPLDTELLDLAQILDH
jgi:6-phosphofructokinase 1